MTRVSLMQCSGYVSTDIKDVLEQSLVNIGFDTDRFKNVRVAVNPNLLMPSPPEKAIITHPEFFRAAVQLVKQYGGRPVLIESPAFHSLDRTIRKTGYHEIVTAEGVDVADPQQTRALHFEGAKSFKSIDVGSAFFDADLILNLPKFKTHGLTYVTGAVKNLFGAIPGLQKSKMHVKLPNGEEFAGFLLDLYGAMQYGFDPPKTVLTFMDAIVCQEGEGPGTSGTPKTMNAVIAGLDAVAVDWVAVRTAGLDADKAYTVRLGFQRDFGVNSPGDIEIKGRRPEDMRVKPFRPSRGTFMSNMIRWPVTSKRFRNLFIDHPLPRTGTCTLCYQCHKICPAGAIGKAAEGGETPVYDYNKCIRCYCCMEICPEAAIVKKRGSLQWLLRM
jgi:uncharacterized protein (DUF362 family)/Pyruvate/2-oxoacid:ferredoxin oxidoreductase delta subunit